MKPQLSDWQITEAMIVFGGSFVTTLGLLWRKGDASNKAILKSAFPRYWQEYANPEMHARIAQMSEPFSTREP